MRNKTLNKRAFVLGTMVARGWLVSSEVFDALWRACDANGLRTDANDGEGKDARHT